MKIKIDRKSDALYICLDENSVVESEEVQPGVVLDFNQAGQVVGIEILNVSTRVDLEQLTKLQFETV